jgi:CRP-like cAMP-binding protein
VADRKKNEIRQLELFAGCRPDDVRWIARVADTVDLPAGQTIVREGQRVREFIVLVRGVASASHGDASVVLAPGSYVGERGLDDDGFHSQTIEASTPVRLLVFSPGAYRGMLERIPAVGRTVLAGKVSEFRTADQDSRSLRAVS